MIFLIFAKNGDLAIFGTRSWEGLTARGGLDGPHLGHPLRRDQVRGSAPIVRQQLDLILPIRARGKSHAQKVADETIDDGFAAG